ncbi:MAG: BatE, domain containing protein [Ignavibacteria bacterium]|nr:BatE, domain containing protein [Ignavibacteria bacterium]
MTFFNYFDFLRKFIFSNDFLNTPKLLISALIIFCTLLIPASLLCEVQQKTPPDVQFKNAEALYVKGKYKEAAKLYEELIIQGIESAELFFNLGNCYYKTGGIASAIVCFERAKRLSPDDEDTDFNLKIANLRTVDKIEPLPKLFIWEWFDSIRNTSSSGGWSRMGIIFTWLFFASLLVFFLSWRPGIKKLFFTISVIAIIITISCYVFAEQKHSEEMATDKAIVFSANAYIKSSPDPASTDLFILHEGTKVQILDNVGQWRKIRLANGAVGWIPVEVLEVI